MRKADTYRGTKACPGALRLLIVRGRRSVTYSGGRNRYRRPMCRPMLFTTTRAGLGVVIGRRDDNDDRPYLHASELQSNVKGVLFLLLSARASLLRHCTDKLCLRTIEDCVSSFRVQHNLTDEDADEGVLWEETSVEGLLRLLEYLQGEASDTLHDQRCAEQLKLCIELGLSLAATPT
jgi:hypothetical protein